MLSFKDFHNQSPKHFKIGDRVRNCNPECEHFGSTGTITKILDLKDPNIPNNIVGKAVRYKCDCCGKNWKKGDELEKTAEQLKLL
jgi:hypothetical protein